MLLLKLSALLFLGCVAKAEQEKFYPAEVTQDIPERLNGKKGCYIPDLDDVIKRDKNYYSETDCAEYTCRIYDTEKGYEAYRYTCDEVEEKEGCTIVKGKERGPQNQGRYPECCDTLKCDSD